MDRKKGLVVGCVLVFVVSFFIFDWQRFFTLDYIQASQDHFASLYAANAVLVVGAYAALYILVTACSLPGAAVLTLAGGALFGFWTGLIVISFASSIGAGIAMLMARFVLRDWVQMRFAKKLVSINQGIEREGGWYLLTLRLVPAVPFFLINLAMGLTRMPFVQFYLVSQIGMLPGTAVYVNAGKELAQINSLAGIVSPDLILSFTLLGIFPLLMKKLFSLVRRPLTEKAHKKD